MSSAPNLLALDYPNGLKPPTDQRVLLIVGCIDPLGISFFRAPDLTSSKGVIQLGLIHVEKLKGEIVWLRYEVVK